MTGFSDDGVEVPQARRASVADSDELQALVDEGRALLEASAMQWTYEPNRGSGSCAGVSPTCRRQRASSPTWRACRPEVLPERRMTTSASDPGPLRWRRWPSVLSLAGSSRTGVDARRTAWLAVRECG